MDGMNQYELQLMRELMEENAQLKQMVAELLAELIQIKTKKKK